MNGVSCRFGFKEQGVPGGGFNHKEVVKITLLEGGRRTRDGIRDVRRLVAYILFTFPKYLS